MPYDYLQPTVKKLLELDDKARIEHIKKDHWIGYPRALHALEKLEYLYTHPKKKSDAKPSTCFTN